MLRSSHLLGLLVFVLAPFAMVQPASAFGLSVSPPSLEGEISAGHSYVARLTVFNVGRTPIRIHAMFGDMVVKENGRERLYAPPGTLENSPVNFSTLTFPEKSVLEPNESTRVEVRMTPPKDAKGAYLGVVRLTAATELTKVEGADAEDDGKHISAGMQLGGELVVPIVLRISGTGEHGIELGSVNISPAGDTTPMEASLEIHNSGTIHGTVTMHVAIYDEKRTFMGWFESEPLRLLPNERRALKAVEDLPLPAGKYTAALTVVAEDGKSYTSNHEFTID